MTDATHRSASGDGPGPARRGGFTLAELLTVTLILGILAAIVAPVFQGLREDAAVAAMEADVANMVRGVEQFVSMKHTWPASVAELEEGSDYVRSRDVEYCWFFAVPGTSWRDPYVLPVAAHPATTRRIYTAYPLWNGRVREYDAGVAGC